MFLKSEKKTNTSILQKIKKQIVGNKVKHNEIMDDEMLSNLPSDDTDGEKNISVEMTNGDNKSNGGVIADDDEVLNDINKVVENAISRNDNDRSNFEENLESDFLADVFADEENNTMQNFNYSDSELKEDSDNLMDHDNNGDIVDNDSNVDDGNDFTNTDNNSVNINYDDNGNDDDYSNSDIVDSGNDDNDKGDENALINNDIYDNILNDNNSIDVGNTNVDVDGSVNSVDSDDVLLNNDNDYTKTDTDSVNDNIDYDNKKGDDEMENDSEDVLDYDDDYIDRDFDKNYNSNSNYNGMNNVDDSDDISDGGFNHDDEVDVFSGDSHKDNYYYNNNNNVIENDHNSGVNNNNDSSIDSNSRLDANGDGYNFYANKSSAKSGDMDGNGHIDDLTEKNKNTDNSIINGHNNNANTFTNRKIGDNDNYVDNDTNNENMNLANHYSDTTSNDIASHANDDDYGIKMATISKQARNSVKNNIMELMDNVKNQILSNRKQNVSDDIGHKTLEQFVYDLIQPAIVSYLDSNIERIVKNAVDKEIRKIVKDTEEDIN